MKTDDTDPAFHAQLRLLQANGGEILARLRSIEIEVRGAVDAQERQQFAIAQLLDQAEPDVPAPNGHAEPDDIPTSEERGRG